MTAAAPDAEIDLGRYWGAVFFTGLRYSTPVNLGLDVYGLGQLGAGFLRGPDVTASAMGETLEFVSSWEPVKGLSAGLGATVNDRFILEARYFHLINPEVSGKIRYSGTVEQFTGDQPVSWVQVTAGIRVM